jgi:2-polyprenyl-6-hydroxyphenyl methylase/3-demethylubiquinone-9 3-methyltransferase
LGEVREQVTSEEQRNAIVGNGGRESACDWCKDKWGISWQITPLVLTQAVTDPDPSAAQ